MIARDTELKFCGLLVFIQNYYKEILWIAQKGYEVAILLPFLL